MFSYIDTVAFIEYGDGVGGHCFKQWLRTYAALDVNRVTVDELWELRNGLLHMTNLESRKVMKGEHARVIMYAGTRKPESERELFVGYKYLNLENFLTTITSATRKWIQTYNIDREKFDHFVKRYDLTVSDSRVAKVNI